MVDRVTHTPKVVDFGIAQAEIRPVYTETGIIKGKIRYMPPEQLNGAYLDHRSDQFSLGVVLWELLAGRHLFSNEFVRRSNQSLSNDAPVPRPDLSADLYAVLNRMLQNDPDERFDSCGSVADELLAFLSQEDESALKEAMSKFVQPFPDDKWDADFKTRISSVPDYVISLAPDSDENFNTPD